MVSQLLFGEILLSESVVRILWLSVSLGSIWGVDHIIPNIWILWDEFGKILVSFSIDPEMDGVEKCHRLWHKCWERAIWAIPWARHVILMEKIKHLPTCFW